MGGVDRGIPGGQHRQERGLGPLEPEHDRVHGGTGTLRIPVPINEWRNAVN
jgi:hypothetical protein